MGGYGMIGGRWVVGAGVLACALACGLDGFDSEGFAPSLGGVDERASDRTRDDLGIDTWRLSLVSERSLSIHALGSDGATIAEGSVTVTPRAWLADVRGRWEGEVEIERSGEIVRHSLADKRMFEYLRDDMADGFRAGEGSVCEQAAAAAEVACNGGEAFPGCMEELNKQFLECEAAVAADQNGNSSGVPGNSETNGQNSGSEGGESGGSGSGGSGSETGSGSGGSGGSESGGSESGGGSSGEWGSSGGSGEWGSSGGYDTE